ncbi:MAG: YkgJ family cysteine cluster protein [Lachnospiraceae bacterium]|nr:YkgJ family cysteine cluster protein [Lachnospiraceae bacterium]
MVLYQSNDMAKVGCNNCKGCSSCCRGMGQSILLDPYDIYQLQTVTGENFVGLMQDKVDIHVENGIILPALKMQPDTDACGFLSKEDRCSIHTYRPGLCRLFPLGRNYDESGLQYFLLEDACHIKTRTKLKIKKWLDVPALARYEKFLVTWHDLRKQIMNRIADQQSDTYTQMINVKLLELFYQKPYDTGLDFYQQFEERIAAISAVI